MDLIVETDIGHDPDDLFAILYLIAAGVNIRAILISPGDPDQIAIAKFLCEKLGLQIPVGTSKVNRTKLSSGSIHHEFLKKYKYPLEKSGDGLGVDILENVLKNYPDSELFIIGPVSSIGSYIVKHPTAKFKRATMQGGFLPYSLYDPKIRNPKFEGAEWMPTFNLNGDRPAGETFMKANVADRRMVGKNVCHTVLFTWEQYRNMGQYNGDASRFFEEAANMYLAKHTDKKFHDPTAACLHLHPEIGTWVRGNTIKKEQGWTTSLNSEGDYILADIDRDKYWQNLLNWT